jgi:DNA-binding MarR family transcriptional regulator
MLRDPFVSILQEWIEVFMSNSMRNMLRYARERGFSMSHLGAMFHILRIGSCGVTDLGDHLGVTSAAASQMLERLVQQELILRMEHPNDRRVKQIILTDKGRRILEESTHARLGWMEDLAQTLSKSEKETIMSGLSILIDKAKSLSQSVETEN